MSVVIKSVIKKSPAYGRGIKDGDVLLSLNRNPVNDFLDYQFYAKDKKREDDELAYIEISNL